MNQPATSREELLSASKKIVAERGLQAVSIREIARQCHVAPGSVYNYFPSKNELMIATIESIWSEILQEISVCNPGYGFWENVENLFYCVKSGGKKYPFFFSAHAVGIAKEEKDQGREVMNQCFGAIKEELLNSLRKDHRVNHTFFSPKCTQTDFIEFIFSNLILLLIQKQKSCDVLTEMIKGAIYER